MIRQGAYEVPSWAIAILFWRKVDQVESRGIPGIAAPSYRVARAAPGPGRGER
jgi:hypothetical protein